jgi:3-methyladenine DNA glycosylase/8-oxoguanine DNA glycosylase
MLDSICRAFGDEVSAGGHRLSVFADPRRLAVASESFLREQCRLGYRAKYLAPLAQVFASGGIDDTEIAAMDPPDAEARLRTIPGVGPYSARVALARRTGTQIALDVWNTKILSDFLFGRPDAEAEEVRAEADRRWGRHQALGALYVVEDRYLSQPLSPIAMVGA